MNIFSKDFDTNFQTPPFSKIKLNDYSEAIDNEILKIEKVIESIIDNREKPTFKNVIEPLELSSNQLKIISSIFFSLNSADTSPEMQKMAHSISEKVTNHGNKIIFNEDLFLKVKIVSETNEYLNEEEKMVLNETYLSFTRNGALLPKEKKNKIKEINLELCSQSLKFGENLLADTNEYFLHIEDEEIIKDLPKDLIQKTRNKAKEKELEGWAITLDYPTYVPFMKYCKSSEYRKQLYLGFGKRAFRKEKYNNEQIIKKIVALRDQKAKILSYKSHSHYVLEKRMAKTPSEVFNFLNDLTEKVIDIAHQEKDVLDKFAREQYGVQKVEAWDVAFYEEKYKKQHFSIDNELVRKYFPLDYVLNQLFKLTQKLYGITFKESFEIEKYHDDVQVFEVLDSENNNDLVGVLYFDPFPRSGKRSGAWMTSFKGQWIENGVNHRPHVSVVCNFSTPSEKSPSQLTFQEVTTLFHEFGHALHGLFANTTFRSLSGTNVYWDFVELPSQIMENWCYEPEVLKQISQHIETKENLPDSIIKTLVELQKFREATQTLRQISYGILDMNYHYDFSKIEDVKEWEDKVMKTFELYPNDEQTNRSCSFAHIFQGGYSAGYYSYKWAEVLDADAYESFKEEGIFNKETAKRFRKEILSKGGTKHPLELFKKFKGREPKLEPLLKRMGIATSNI